MKHNKSNKYGKLVQENMFNHSRDQGVLESTPGYSKLVTDGNLQEASAVFTLDGMKMLMTMFDENINKSAKQTAQVIREEIHSIVADTVEEKLLQVLKGANLGLQEFLKLLVVPTEEPEIAPAEIPTEEPIVEEKISPRTDMIIINTSTEDFKIYTPYLLEAIKTQKKDFRLVAVCNIVIEEHNIKFLQPTKAIQYLIREGYPIRKTAFGVYRYEGGQGEDFEVVR